MINIHLSNKGGHAKASGIKVKIIPPDVAGLRFNTKVIKLEASNAARRRNNTEQVC